MKRRPDGFDLVAAARSSGFTPRAGDLAPLIALLATCDDDDARVVERALGRLGTPAAAAALAALGSTTGRARPRLVRVLARVVAVDTTLASELLALLDDDDPATRRAAAGAAGKLRGPGVEPALLARLDREQRPDVRRAVVGALGKLGGPAARKAIAVLAVDGDPGLARVAARAETMLERTLGRPQQSELLATRLPASAVTVRFWCRPGFEPALIEELGTGARGVAAGVVEQRRRATLAELGRARTAMSFGIVLGSFSVDRRGAGVALAEALAGEPASTLLHELTRGIPRFRIEWLAAGPRRAESFAAARRLRELFADLVNDPTHSPWEARVHERAGRIDVALVPKALPDERFAYRVADVPAASHPSVAAALVRLAGARPDDVGWDPFVGSGLELCERALAGPYRLLFGTDTDPRAVAAARANVASARLRGVEIVVADALAFEPPQPLTLIVTNPPMGRRVLSRAAVPGLLVALVERAATRLAPGGRMLWVSPSPHATADAARRSGLHVRLQRAVDLGGIRGELQHFERAQASGARGSRPRR